MYYGTAKVPYVACGQLYSTNKYLFMCVHVLNHNIFAIDYPFDTWEKKVGLSAFQLIIPNELKRFSASDCVHKMLTSSVRYYVHSNLISQFQMIKTEMENKIFYKSEAKDL